jgi:adenylate cyclase
VGLTNFFSDTDGMVRRFVPALFGNDSLPNLTFATLLAVRAAGLDPKSDSWSLGGEMIMNAPHPRRIGFVGPPGTVPRLSFGRLLATDAVRDPEIQRLRGKVIIVAAEHAGMQDIHLSPYAQGLLTMEGRAMTGAELHANIVETLLTGRFPRSVPSPFRLIYVAGVLIAGTILFFRLRPWLGLATGFLLGLSCAVLSYAMFHINWVLPVTNVHLALALSYLGALGLRVTGEERERVRLRQMFGQYVSDDVVEKLLATGHRPDLGGEALQVTILFADIRNFTMISERLSPHQVVDMLNAYLSRVCEPVLEEGGTVDKFIGDAVMAIFGSPVFVKNHARHALRAALAMAATARQFQTWMHQRFPGLDQNEFRIGIGLHTGNAVIGNIGSPKRREFTAIGDTVNTASRLERMTKELGYTIVASEATIAAAGPGVLTGKKEKLHLKGRKEPVEAFEVIGMERDRGGEP